MATRIACAGPSSRSAMRSAACDTRERRAARERDRQIDLPRRREAGADQQRGKEERMRPLPREERGDDQRPAADHGGDIELRRRRQRAPAQLVRGPVRAQGRAEAIEEVKLLHRVLAVLVTGCSRRQVDSSGRHSRCPTRPSHRRRRCPRRPFHHHHQCPRRLFHHRHRCPRRPFRHRQCPRRRSPRQPTAKQSAVPQAAVPGTRRPAA